jgi:hypothetical protein
MERLASMMAACGNACPASSINSQPMLPAGKFPSMRSTEANVVEMTGTTRNSRPQVAQEFPLPLILRRGGREYVHKDAEIVQDLMSCAFNECPIHGQRRDEDFLSLIQDDKRFQAS